MTRALSALLLLLSAATIPLTAHASACASDPTSWSFFRSYNYSQAKAAFSPALVCSLNGNPVFDNCVKGGSAAATVRYLCTQSGVSGNYVMTVATDCSGSGGGFAQMKSTVVYQPNMLYHFTQTCTCSEGITNCSWN